jgi:hypothetical protein
MTLSRQSPTEKSWFRFMSDVSEGHKWNLSLINAHTPSTEGGVGTEARIIDFHEIISLPRAFLEAWTIRAGASRLRLLPPYREHLSQAFARYFMRGGLPLNITRTWYLDPAYSVPSKGSGKHC